MSPLAQVVTTVSVLLGIAGLAGTLWAGFKGAASQATIKRLREDSADYLGRLNYIEPRMAAAEKSNEVLMALHNPQAALEELGDKIDESRTAMTRLLEDQHRTLMDVARVVHVVPRKEP